MALNLGRGLIEGFREGVNRERLVSIVERIRICSVQIFNKDFFGPIFFALCPQ